MDKRRKELLFLAAGLAVLLLALYFTLKPSTPAAHGGPAPAGRSERLPVPAAPTPAAQVQVAVAPIPMSEGGSPAGRNPFTPAISTTRAAVPVASAPTFTAPPSLPPLRPLPLGFSMVGPSSGAAITPAVAAPAEPPLRLTGVIYGNPSIAILRKGDKRYYVRPGDPIGSRYVVQSISHRQVVLVGAREGRIGLGLPGLQLDLTGRL